MLDIYELTEDVPPQKDPTDSEELQQLIQEEKSLPLSQRLTHHKFLIRKRVYSELKELLTENEDLCERYAELKQNMLGFTPWLKNIVNEPNQVAFKEGLLVIDAYLDNIGLGDQVLQYFIGGQQILIENKKFYLDLMDKLPNLKPNLQEIANSILQKCYMSDHASFIIQEILKHLETPHKRTKISLLNQLKQQLCVENTLLKLPLPLIKTLFGNCLKIYEKAKEIEIRKGALEAIKLIYQVIKENANDVADGLNREVLKKELIAQLEKIHKVNESERVAIFFGNDNKGDFKAKTEMVDLNIAIAPKFLKIQYTFEQGVKIDLLTEFNKSIGSLIENHQRIDKSKDFNQIFSVITQLIEETNIKIYNEALKSLQLLIKLFGKDFPFFTYNKKNTQNIHNKHIQSILNEAINQHCISLDSFLEIFLSQIENNRNQAVKLGCIEHLQNNFVEERLGGQSKNLMKKQGNQQQFVKLNMQILEKQKKSEVFFKDLENKLSIFIEKEKGNVQLKRACEQLVERIKSLLLNPKNYDQQENKENIERQQAKDEKKGKINPKKNRLDKLNQKIQARDEDQSDNEIQQQEYEEDPYEFSSLPINQRLMMQTIRNELQQIPNYCTESQIISRLEPFTHMLDKFSLQLDCFQQIQELAIKKISKHMIKVGNNNSSKQKGIMDRITEFLWNVFCIVNKISMELTSKSLYNELKVLMLQFGRSIQQRKLELLLDSAYMTCTLENFLKITYFLFEKINTKVPNNSADKLEQNLNFLIRWLSIKIQKCSLCLLSEGSLQFLSKSFSEFHFVIKSLEELNLQQTLVRCLKNKLKNIENDKLNQQQIQEQSSKKLFNSPTQMNNTKLKLEEISQSLSDFNQSLLQNQQLQPPNQQQQYSSPNRPWLRGQGRGPLESSNANLTAPSQNLEDSLCISGRLSQAQRSYQTCQVNNLSMVSEIIEKKNNGEEMEFEEIKGLLETICANLEQEQVDEAFKVFGKFSELLNESSPFLQEFLQIIFTQFCTNLLFEKYANQQLMQNFLDNLIQSLPQNCVLQNYKKCFKLVKKKQNSQKQCEILIKQMIGLLCSNYFPTGVDLENVNYFIESIVYCLENKELAEFGDQWMREVFERLPEKKIQLIFEQELITQNNDFFTYLNWQDQYFEEKLEKELNAKESNEQQQQEVKDDSLIMENYKEEYKKNEKKSNQQIKKIAIEENTEGIDSLTMGNYEVPSTMNKTNEVKASHFQFLEFDSLKQFQNNFTENMDKKLLQSPSVVQYNQDFFSKQKDNLNNQDNTLQLSIGRVPEQSNASAIKIEEEYYGKSFFLTEEQQNDTIHIIKELEEKLKKEMEKNVATLKLLERVNLDYTQLDEEKNLIEDKLKNSEIRNQQLEQENQRLRNQLALQQQEFEQKPKIKAKANTFAYFYQTYTSLKSLDQKIIFLKNLQNKDFSQNQEEYEAVLQVSLVLCVASGIQKQEEIILQELQMLLEYLLTSVIVERVIVGLVRVVGRLIPAEYSQFEFNKEDKMTIRLALKCLERLINNCSLEGIDIHFCLAELFHFFEQHPPELLYEDVPCIQDMELVFRSFKTLSDKIIESSVEEAQQFILASKDLNKNGVFYTYIVALINQYS